MVSATLARGLAALVLSIGVQAQGTTCSQTVTARAGDTCASLAELAGISVTQFLRSNPYVTSCSALIGGAVYCKEGTATGPPVAPAAATPAATSTRSSIPIQTSPSGELRVSTDGSCGGSVTCAGSRFGLCCSAHGFCGTSADYCGEGCQVGLGECASGGVTPSSPVVSEEPVQQPTGNPGIATSTTTITATIFVTSTVAETTGTTTSTAVVTTTTLAYGSTTSTIVQSVTATATTTQTVRATVVVTSTVFQTSTVTRNTTLTETARVTATATSTQTRSTTETSVAITSTTATALRTSLTIVTRTVHVTDTITTVLTSTAIVNSTSVIPLTTVVTSTAIVTATSVNQVTSTALATATSVRQVTSTAVVTATSVRQVTSTAVVTSTSIRQVTSTLFLTLTTTRETVVTAIAPAPTFFQPTSQVPTFIIGSPIGGGGGGPTFTTISVIQPAEPTPARPSPILPGSARQCKSYDKIVDGDTCRTLAERNNLLLRDFYQLNPSVSSSILNSLLCTPDLLSQLLSGLCKINCDDLWLGYYVCTSV